MASDARPHVGLRPLLATAMPLALAAAILAPAVVAPPASAAPAGAISVGYSHSCALTSGGGVRCWGTNAFGELGDGSTTPRSTPVQVVGLSSGVTAIAAGRDHSCALTIAGGVKCWGSNTYGQLGDGTKSDSSTPVEVSGLASGVAQITVGGYHTCAVTLGGAAKCWGFNGSGRLGDGTTTDRPTPVPVSGLTSGVAALSAGAYDTCALTTGGAAMCWGPNLFGELGDGTTSERDTPVGVRGLSSGVTAISVGARHTCAIKTGGAWCWGWNFYGVLGDGTTTDSSRPVAVSGLSTGVGWISSGWEHTCAITDGAAKCWGNNESGRLGNGSTTDSPTPVDVSGLSSGVRSVSAGGAHSCTISVRGRAKCWGSNVAGRLGNGHRGKSLTPVQVSHCFPGEVARPDVLLAAGGNFVGQDIYDGNGGGQSLSVVRAPGETATFTLRTENDGDAFDVIRVHGRLPSEGFTLVVTKNGNPVRGGFVAGTLAVKLPPGTSADLVIAIKVKASTVPGSVETQRIRVVSTNDLSFADVVVAQVTATSP
jgi:alpha-tubulin suppressor-like RCC1 family protein